MKNISSQTFRWLLIATAAGLFIRLGWALCPVARSLPDEPSYDHLAASLAVKGEFANPFGKPTAAVPPGWPFLISMAYRITSPNIKAARCLAAFLGAALVVPAFLLSAELFGPTAGLFSAWIVALHPQLIYWSGVAMTEMPFALFCCLGLMFFVRDKTSVLHSVGEGFLWGFTILVRVTALPIAVLLAILKLLQNRKQACACFLAGLTLLPLFWGYRNYKALGRFGLDFHGGYTFILGNNFHNEWKIDNRVANEAIMKQQWYPELSRMGEADKDRFLMQKTKEFVLANKTLVLRQWGYFLRQFWRPYPRMDHAMPHNKKILFWLSAPVEFPLFFFAAVGIWLKRSLWKKWIALVVFIVALTCVHVISVGQMRYRLPVTPLLAVFAGAALADLLNKLRDKARLKSI